MKKKICNGDEQLGDRNIGIAKSEITLRLKEIAKLLKIEYQEDSKKTTRKIYQVVAGLHNDIKDNNIRNED